MPAQPSQHSALTWRKSKKSDGGATCVEVACDGYRVMTRDTSDRSGPMLAVSPAQWTVFLGRVKSGEPLS